MIDVSVIYSVYDRREYVLRALSFLERQTLPTSQWEVVIIDHNSPGDYVEDLRPFKGKIQLQYAKFNDEEHPIVQQLNPNGRPLLPPYDVPLKFHTPALSHNLGFRLAQGRLLFITQPDILQKETNLETALNFYKRNKRAFYFGRVWMSSPRFRTQVLGATPEALKETSFEQLKSQPGAKAHTFKNRENYWFVSALEKEAVERINGVDEDYLGGVFAEDDNFRVRCELAGWPTLFTDKLEGIHIDHSQLNGRHDRHSERWKWGANRNRSMWVHWNRDPNKKAVANTDRTWGDLKYVTRHEIWM